MAGVAERIGEAAAAHRQAVAIVTALGAGLGGHYSQVWSPTADRSVRELAGRLRVAAGLLAPEWLGTPLAELPATAPVGVATRPELVRIGTAYPLDDAGFPVVVPLGHLAVDGDARDPRVAGLLRSVVLRLLASERPGSLLVRVVDASGGVFAPFAVLHEAGIMAQPVADRAGLDAVLTEAEEWVRAGEPDAGTRLLVVASWPLATEPVELTRLSALASAGPAAGLHLLLAGWPPLLLGEDSTEPVVLNPDVPGSLTVGRSGPPLPHATRVSLRNPYALVGHPPGGSFATVVPVGEAPSAGLNARVFLDESPPDELTGRVCGELATTVVRTARERLGAVLPDGPLWAASARAGLETEVGRAGEAPVTLHLSDVAPHWLIVGGEGSGKTALLLDILYGLCSRYGPDQLRCYLLDLSGGHSFAEFVPQPDDPSYLPHARAVELRPNRADAVAVLRALRGELDRRAELPEPVLPRLVCLIDGVDELVAGAGAGSGGTAGVGAGSGGTAGAGAGLKSTAGEGELARAAVDLLESLSRGGPHGIHLILAGRSLPPQPVAGQCRVRIALPGGAAALDPANRSADELARGSAVVNTAGGLGGPARATRAHEQVVQFPDPHPHAAPLAGLRYRLWRAGGGT